MKKLFLYGAMATGLMLTACQSDDLVPDDGGAKADVDRTFYVKVNIHGDNSAFTRAGSNGDPALGETTDENGKSGDFQNGVDNGNYHESEVNTVYFVFYDENGNPVGQPVQPSSVTWETGDPDTNTVEKYGQTIVQVEVPKTSGDPKSVICYINPIAPQSLQFDLKTIQTVLRDRVWRSEFGFAMSNSVYYPNAEGTTSPASDAIPQIDVPIDKEQLKDTYAEAEASTNVAMDIYVERYAAKLTFNLAETTTDENSPIVDYTTGSPVIGADGTASDNSATVSLHFNALKWALNAESKNTYMIKSFREETATGQILPNNYTFGALNKILTASISRNDDGSVKYTGGLDSYIQNQWRWNNANYHRSYWAISPAYFTQVYPEVSDDVNSETSLQKYYTYNELNSTGSTLGFPLTTKTGYFKETTVGSRALTANNPKAAVASVILTGYYDVTVNNENKGAVTFYTYNKSADGNDLVFFEATGDDGASAVGAGESMLSRFIAATSILYTKDAAGNYVPATKAEILPHVEIVKHKHEETGVVDGDADAKIASRLRTLQLKPGTVTSGLAGCGLYVATGSGYCEIVNTITDANSQITLATANENLYQQVGSCAKYDGGKAYFNIPVMHYGWYRSDNENKSRFEDGGLSAIEWSDVKVGDFGVVRNHSYTINVTELKGIGTGIGDPNDPIVPPADTKTYYVKYRINILKWAVVPEQNVKL